PNISLTLKGATHQLNKRILLRIDPPAIAPVSLTINPTQIHFGMHHRQSDTKALTLTIQNTGKTDFVGRLDATVSWLEVTPRELSIPADTTAKIMLTLLTIVEQNADGDIHETKALSLRR